MVEIEVATGGRTRITGPVDAATVSALIKALAQSSSGHAEHAASETWHSMPSASVACGVDLRSGGASIAEDADDRLVVAIAGEHLNQEC
jgi:hypothetical protein